MKLLKQTRNNCLLYSAAMLLDVEPEILIEETGHDGQEVVYPHLPMPQCLRGHHMQEIIDCCMRRGLSLTPVEVYPRGGKDSTDNHLIFPMPAAHARFIEAVLKRPGIIVGESDTGHGHAWAWDGEKVYDPNGVIRDLEDIYIKEAWLLGSLSK